MRRKHTDEGSLSTVAAASANVVVAAGRGEEWALAYLYRLIHPTLLRYLGTCAPGEEEDLAAEVWLDVASALDRFLGDLDDFRRFVFSIARRRAIDHGRKSRRRSTQPVDVERFDQIPDSADPEAVVLERLNSQDAARMLRAVLPPEQAEVVLLRVVAGLSVAEVAALLGRRRGAISVLQHRALRRLAMVLGHRALEP
jgi:RNA polymerase sigma-70 factor (ECF subfamily)